MQLQFGVDESYKLDVPAVGSLLYANIEVHKHNKMFLVAVINMITFRILYEKRLRGTYLSILLFQDNFQKQ